MRTGMTLGLLVLGAMALGSGCMRPYTYGYGRVPVYVAPRYPVAYQPYVAPRPYPTYVDPHYPGTYRTYATYRHPGTYPTYTAPRPGAYPVYTAPRHPGTYPAHTAPRHPGTNPAYTAPRLPGAYHTARGLAKAGDALIHSADHLPDPGTAFAATVVGVGLHAAAAGVMQHSHVVTHSSR
jgi:hypothetical protein